MESIDLTPQVVYQKIKAAIEKHNREFKDIFEDLKEQLTPIREESFLIHAMRLILEIEYRATSPLYTHLGSPMKQTLYLIDVYYSIEIRTESVDMDNERWDKIATLLKDMEMTYFINKGKGFKGDIGVGIFDMEGKLLTPCPSDDYATGGFTQRMYAKYDDGIMKRDYLINVPQKIKVDLSNLSDGYYQLLPICVPKKNDGSWGEWIRMKLAPRMIVEIRNHTVRVAEEDFITAGFQFSEQPSTTHFKPGSEEVACFSIRNKGGLERTCYAKLQLLDTNDHVSLEIRQQQKTVFTGFDTTLWPFTFNIPT